MNSISVEDLGDDPDRWLVVGPDRGLVDFGRDVMVHAPRSLRASEAGYRLMRRRSAAAGHS